jgi:hypothetical protein
MQNVEALTQQYAKSVEAKVQAVYHFMDEDKRPVVEVEVGRKYFKLVTVHSERSRSVHSFVDRVTGDVLKAAGWAAPAKGARFNLATGMNELLAAVDPYGSYLYMR